MSALFIALFICPSLWAEQVIAVIDGDTIKLADERIIRIIGIDAPELGRRGKPGEAYAKTSKKRLAELIRRSGFKIKLAFDRQHKDRYQRGLAYVQLNDGSDAGEILLKEGLATLLLIPPNIARAEIYSTAENSARKQLLKIWGEPDKQPLHAEKLTGEEIGYHIIQGKVSHFRATKYNHWLTLDTQLTIKLTRKDARLYFKKFNPKKLFRKTVEVRGKLYHYKGQQRLRLRHPAYINF